MIRVEKAGQKMDHGLHLKSELYLSNFRFFFKIIWKFQQPVYRVLKLAIYFSNSVALSLGAQSNFNGQKSVHPVCSNTYMQELESACPV